MRSWDRLGLTAVAAALFTISVDADAAPRACGPHAIGLARTIEVEAKGGPRFGQNQYPGRELLADREVILTFDDGPHKLYTQPILDALDAHCTRATFFMVGQRALSYPDLARDVVRRGHSVGTHSWSHRDLAKVDPETARTEIELGISAVQKVVGAHAAPFFRFPYLSDPSEMTAHLRARNTAIFSIDVDSYDFRTHSPTKVISNVMRQLDSKGRGILLFHDIQPSTAAAIGELLSELKIRGYRVAHVVPVQAQITVAAYDGRIAREHGGGRIALASVPLAHRGIVSPGWEARVSENAISGRVQPSSGSGRPVAAPVPAPTRPAVARDTWESNWFKSIIRGW